MVVVAAAGSDASTAAGASSDGSGTMMVTSGVVGDLFSSPSGFWRLSTCCPPPSSGRSDKEHRLVFLVRRLRTAQLRPISDRSVVIALLPLSPTPVFKPQQTVAFPGL